MGTDGPAKLPSLQELPDLVYMGAWGSFHKHGISSLKDSTCRLQATGCSVGARTGNLYSKDTV